jgi:hypothetical protein
MMGQRSIWEKVMAIARGESSRAQLTTPIPESRFVSSNKLAVPKLEASSAETAKKSSPDK